MTPVCLSVRFLYLNTTAGRPVVSRYVVCVKEEELDGWNGGKTSTSLTKGVSVGQIIHDVALKLTWRLQEE